LGYSYVVEKKPTSDRFSPLPPVDTGAGKWALKEQPMNRTRTKKPALAKNGKRRAEPSRKRARECLLTPENPAEGFLTPEEWVSIGTALDLSSRELCVAILIFEGHTRGNISRTLHRADGKPISPGTVRVYIDRVFEKFHVKDRVGLVLRILRVHRSISANFD
jgi:DNA-binding NarL/FixJ family response regulator